MEERGSVCFYFVCTRNGRDTEGRKVRAGSFLSDLLLRTKWSVAMVFCGGWGLGEIDLKGEKAQKVSMCGLVLGL